MKYCSHCGAELLDEAVICPKCGCPVQVTNATYVQQVRPVKTKEEKQALAGMILGIIGLVCGFGGGIAGLVCSILGLVFSVKARRAGIYNGKTMAGMVCSIIGLVVTVIFGILGFIFVRTAFSIVMEIILDSLYYYY